MTEKEIKQVLIDRREELGLSKYAVVKDKALSSAQELDKLELGDKSPQLRTLLRYLDYLGLKIEIVEK
ncbi:helix-turn-helix domain-containing protein [Porphyromonas endodontalis]|uniref:helix-turn-helix domain-containing protein n=1 Tax=Porphyromonas endodontalis TaxID=28124 RepID=UPI0028E9BF0E|nr:helix-turn-helix domain-containing protein [Porphyromonas endodontalis]